MRPLPEPKISRLFSVAILAGFLISLVVSPLASAEWTMGRGEPTRTGKTDFTPFTKVTRVEVRREVSLGENHLGSPVVAEISGEKVIFVGSRDNRLYAINSDGTTRWSYPTGGPVYSVPAVGDVDGDGDLDVAFSSMDGWFYVLEADNGGLVWKFEIGMGSQAAPIIYDVDGDGKNEVVFNLGYPSTIFELRPYVYALNGESGSVLWTVSIDGNVFSAPSVADVDGDGKPEVVFGSVNGNVYVVSGENGRTKWSRSVGGRIYSTVPISDIDGNGSLDLIACTWENGVHALRASDGGSIWSVPFSVIPYVQTDPAVGDLDGNGTVEVVVASRSGRIFCLKGSSGEVLWSFQTVGEILSSPTLADINADGVTDVLFGTDENREAGENAKIFALNGKNGKILWLYERPGNVRSEIVVADLDSNGWPDILATGYLDSRVTLFRTVTVLSETTPEELEEVISSERENTVVSTTYDWNLYKGLEIRLAGSGGYWENTGQKTVFPGGYGEAVVGAGNYLYILRCWSATSTVYFIRYNPENKWFESLARPPDGTFRSGTYLAWDNGDRIYALAGGRTDDNRYEFWCYSISQDSWTRLADTPYANPVGSYENYAGQGAGDALTWVPGWVLGVSDDNYLYAFLGKQARPGGYYRGHASIFARYSVKNNTWEILPFHPDWDNLTDDGASLVWAGGRYLYALQGEYMETTPNGNFARFDLLENRWENLPSLLELETGGIGDGGQLLWTGEEDYIYAAGGGSCWEEHSDNFYRFNIRENRWERLPNLPWRIDFYVGPRLAYAAGRILFWAGNPDGVGDGEIWEFKQRFATSGRYLSRVFDLGALVSWESLSLEAEVPTLLIGENVYVSSEPQTTSDGSSRTGASKNSGLTGAVDGLQEVIQEASNAVAEEITERWASMPDWPGLLDVNTTACYAENLLSGRRYVYAFDTRCMYRFDIFENVWENLGTNPGSTTTAGSGMVWTRDNYIYMTRGGSGTPNFWRYNIPDNVWEVLASVPSEQYAGSSLAWGGGDNIYAVFAGSTSSALYVYSINFNIWTKLCDLAGTPPAPASGSSLAVVGKYLYYSVGGSTGYWRYSISDNTWAQLASAPASWGAGGAQEVANENYIYAVRGGTTTGFYRYSIPENRWQVMASLPATVSYANDRLVFDGVFLYMIRGYSDRSFWRFAPAWWENLSPWPGTVGSAVACYAENGGRRYIYVLESKSSPRLFRYNIDARSWEGPLLTWPATTATGSGMVWDRGDYLYVNSGGTTASANSFYRYRISTNTCESRASPNVAAYTGSGLAYDGGDNIYGLFRSGTTTTRLYVYRISTNTWTYLADAPASADSGSTIVRVGPYLYFQRGGTTSFWRYSIAGNVWESLAPLPSASGAGSSAEKYDNNTIFLAGAGSPRREVYRYSISDNTWSRVADVLSDISNANDRLATDGTYLYMVRGYGDSSFWRYRVKTVPAYSLNWQQTISVENLYEPSDYTYAQPYSFSLVKGGVTSLDNVKFADDMSALFSERRYVDVYENRGTTTENTTSTSFVDLPDTRVSVSVPDNSYLIINFHAAHNSNTAGDKAQFRIMVGSYVAAYGYSEMGVAGQDTTVSLTRAFWVSPGNYTVKAQWRRSSGSGTLYCWERSMTVWVIPENAFPLGRQRETTSVSTTSDSFVELSGMSVQVAVSENSYLFADFHAAFDHTQAGGKVEFRMLVGSTEIAHAYGQTTTAGQDLMASMTRAYEVPPGTYTVKVEWRRASGTGTVYCWERSLNVVAIPKRALAVWDARDTTTSSTSGSTWASLPGASLSVNTSRPSVLAVQFHASFNINASGNKAEFMLRVDGNPEALGYGYMGTASQDTAIGLVAMCPVGSGSHTVDVQWRVSDGSGTAYCWEKSLNAIALENLYDFETLADVLGIPAADSYALQMRYRLLNSSDNFIVYVSSPHLLYTENTLALWRFDEGGGLQVFDSTPNNHTGVIRSGGPRWVGGRFGYALRFENVGTPQYVEIPYSPSLTLGENFFVELWVKPERDYPAGAPSNRWYIFARQDTPAGGERWVLGYQTWDNALEFKVVNASGTGFSAKYPTGLQAGRWYHVAGVKQGSKLKLYLDGRLVAQTDFSGSITSAGKMYISWHDVQSWVDTFNGVIDEVRIENRAPLGSENVLLYNDSGFPTTPNVYTWSEYGDAVYDSSSTAETPPEGVKSFRTSTNSSHWAGWGIFYEITVDNVVDSSGRNNHGVPYNVTEETGKLGTALRFNGTNAYVSVADSSSLNPARVTVEAWAYFAEQPPAGGRQVIVSKFEGASWNSKGYELYIETTSGGQFQLVFGVAPGSGEWGSFAVYPTTFQTGWHHLVGTYNGSRLALYYDGSQVATADWTGNIASNTKPLCVGRKADGEWGYFKGIIDEVRVENQAISATEVSYRYNSGSGRYVEPNENTVLLFHFDNYQHLNLSDRSALKFWVKTSENLKVEIEAPRGTTETKYISDYGWDGTDVWQEITIPASAWSNLSNVYSPFKITIENSGTFYVDHVVWLPSDNAASNEIAQNYLTDSELSPDGQTVGLWHLNDSGDNIADSSVWGNSGALSGGGLSWSSDSVHGYSLHLTGLNGFVSVPHSTTLAPSGGLPQLSVSAWIKPHEITGHHTIIAKRSYVWEPTNGWQMYLEPATDPTRAKLCVVLKSSGAGYYGVAINNAVPLDQWTHVAFTYDGSAGTIRVYINGTDNTSQDVWGSRGGPGSVVSAPDNLFIGCINGTAEWFVGWIDEVRVENRALTPDEIAADASLQPGWKKVCELRGTEWQTLIRELPAGTVENGKVSIRIVDADPYAKSQGGLYVDYVRVAGYRLWENQTLRIYGYSSGDSERIYVYVWNGVGWEMAGTLPQGSPGWLNIPVPYLYVKNTSSLCLLYRSEDDNDKTPTKVYLDFVGFGEASAYSTSLSVYVLLSSDGENWQAYGPFTSFPADLSSLPPARFVRYELRLGSERENMTPIVRNVEIRVAAYTQDENIAWGGVFFDSFSESHLSPNGLLLRRLDGSRVNSVLAGENITVRIRAFRGDLSEAKLHLMTSSGERVVQMARSPSGRYDFWTATFSMPPNENWSYFFELRDGATVGYYADDSSRDGGEGSVCSSEAQARAMAFGIYAQALPTDPQSMVIYEVMIDRFYDGDPSNNDPSQSQGLYDSRRENGNWKYYWGGDLKGLIQKLDYIAGMGASAIWITPIVNNMDLPSEYDNSTGYHGYWAKDFKQIEEHFGTWQDVYTLVSEARKRNIRIIMDWTPNHTGPAYYGENGALYDNGTFWTDYRRDWFTDVFFRRGTSTVSTTSTTWTDLDPENTTLNIRIGENSYLIVNFYAAHNKSNWGKAQFRILVGDNEVAVGYSHMGAVSQDTTVSLTRAVFVGQGVYTVKAQWRKSPDDGDPGTFYCWDRGLSVMVVPATWGVQDNRATDWVTTTSTSFVDMPGMSSQITVGENSYLYINFHAAHNVDHSSGDGRAEFRIMVGSTEVARGYTNSPWKQDLMASLTRLYFVTPGTYTVSVQWRSVNGYTLGAWERSLNVVAVPAGAVSAADNRATSLVSTSSSSWASLPNVAQTISLSEPRILAVRFHASAYNTTSGGKPQFRIVVDGNPVATGYSYMAMANGDISMGLVSAVLVGSGSHTIGVEWRTDGGGTAYCRERSLNTVAMKRSFNEFTWSWDNGNVFRHNGDMDMGAQNDRWNIRYRNLLQLADLNQLNPAVDNYLKEALKLFLDAGIGGLRIDAAKHMDPAWLETLADFVYSGWENVFIMHESVVGFYDETYWDVCHFDNTSGMHMINTPLAFVIRDVFGWKTKNMYDLESYVNRQFSYPVSDILWNQKVVNAVACHDWSRFRSMNSSTRDSELAEALVLTLPGIPLVYYGEEQYMHNDNVNPNGEVGGDPYNRGMMVGFDNTTTYYRAVKMLADLRKLNPALRYGIISTRYVSSDVYVFERKFFNDVVLVAVNLGSSDATLTNLSVSLPDDNYSDYLKGLLGNGQTMTVSGGVIPSLKLPGSSMGVWYCLVESDDPWLGAIDPVVGRAGNRVRISGKGFGSTQGQVVFDNGTAQVSATVLEWADDHIYFQVPSGIGVPSSKRHVDVYVRTSSGENSNRIPFQYLTDRLVLVVHRLDNTRGTELETTFGEFLFVTGSVPEYGNWSGRSENAVGPMLCPSWDNWFIVTAVPRSTYIEFKFIKATLGGSGTWESGSNHTLTSPENGVLYRRSRPGGGAVGYSLPSSGFGLLSITSSESSNPASPPENGPAQAGENENVEPSQPSIITSVDSDRISWSLTENAEVVVYEVEIDEDPTFSSPITLRVGDNFLNLSSLGLSDGSYFWRVKAVLSDNREIVSDVGTFEIRSASQAGAPSGGSLWIRLVGVGVALSVLLGVGYICFSHPKLARIRQRRR